MSIIHFKEKRATVAWRQKCKYTKTLSATDANSRLLKSKTYTMHCSKRVIRLSAIFIAWAQENLTKT